jgi:hypothetical protein
MSSSSKHDYASCCISITRAIHDAAAYNRCLSPPVVALPEDEAILFMKSVMASA